MLNISIANIIYTVINILILFFVCKRFLFGRVDKILEERKKEIEEATGEAVKAKEDAEKKISEYNDKLSFIDSEREKMLSETKEKCAQDYDAVVSNARKEADQIIDDARRAAHMEAQKVREQQATQLEELILGAAGKISSSKHDEETDRQLYDEFIRMGANGFGL